MVCQLRENKPPRTNYRNNWLNVSRFKRYSQQIIILVCGKYRVQINARYFDVCRSLPEIMFHSLFKKDFDLLKGECQKSLAFDL